MLGCECRHEANMHGTADLFGARICLSPGCDCDGDEASKAADRAAQRAQSNRTLQKLVDTIAEVMRNPMPRTIDDTSRNVAAAIVSNFKIEERE